MRALQRDIYCSDVSLKIVELKLEMEYGGENDYIYVGKIFNICMNLRRNV